MAVPTQFERESAEMRANLAAKGEAERRQAIAACGPGAAAYGIWIAKDRSGREPDRLVYCCQRSGQRGWQPSSDFPGSNDRWEEHEGYDFNGQNVKPFRWSSGLKVLNEYRPQTAEQLAAARERRELKEAEAAAAEAARLAAMPKQLTLF